MPRLSYSLTPQLVAAHGGPVLCLHEAGVGATHPLYSERPTGTTRHASAWHGAETLTTRLDMPGPAGDILTPAAPPEVPDTPVCRVDIRGALAKEAGYADPCAAYSDGHDAVAARLIAALEYGDVLMVIDGPGGAGAGLFPAVAAVQAVKDRLGRHVTAYIPPGGMMCSAHLAWGTIADEHYCASDAQIGSVGARAAHMSIAGALAQEGVVVTYSYWPGPGKIAGAPELPQSAEDKRRADRDVGIVGEAFAACVLGSAANLRRLTNGAGLTMETIGPAPAGLEADTRIGSAGIGLFVDGVATLADVQEYALALASGGEAAMPTSAAADVPPVKTDDDGGEMAGNQPKTACAVCGMENRPEAKFCDQCGGTMAAPPLEEEPKPEDKPKPKTSASAGAPATRVASQPASLSASAQMDAALASNSLPAIKAAGLRLKTEVARVEGNRRAEAEIAEANASRLAAEKQWGLATRLNKLNLAGWPRTDIFRDKIEGDKRTAVGLQPRLSTWDPADLEAYVTRHEAAAKPKGAPFADQAAAKTDAASRAAAEGIGGNGAPVLGADGEPTQAQITAALALPEVQKMIANNGTKLTQAQIAAEHVRTLANLGIPLTFGGAS